MDVGVDLVELFDVTKGIIEKISEIDPQLAMKLFLELSYAIDECDVN